MSLACFKSMAVCLFFSILFFWDAVKLMFSLAELFPLPPCTSNEPASSSRFSLESSILDASYTLPLPNDLCTLPTTDYYAPGPHSLKNAEYRLLLSCSNTYDLCPQTILCPIPNYSTTDVQEMLNLQTFPWTDFCNAPHVEMIRACLGRSWTRDRNQRQY